VLSNIGEISLNIYENIVFVRFFSVSWVIASCDLDLSSQNPISISTKPNTSVAKIGWNSLHWF